MKPLSEKELREKIGRIVFDYPKPDSPNLGDTIDEIMNLILSDRKAWGEQVMEYAKMKINKYSIHAPRGYPKGTVARRQLLGSLDNWMNKQQRNQGEKD